MSQDLRDEELIKPVVDLYGLYVFYMNNYSSGYEYINIYKQTYRYIIRQYIDAPC
jgi:hypothetical protein